LTCSMARDALGTLTVRERTLLVAALLGTALVAWMGMEMQV
jgi:uncharacterized membrane protein YsdA (DUF1294 family)